LLLKQEAGTLIVDQPEDDLDNKVIMEVAHLLQVTKPTRQLIFATHNPNFVVNGDADKVIALAFSGQSDDENVAKISIGEDGAIETPEVREAITEIMEGGANAFELRARKYQFHI
jgi:ABC-type cobalamin/Fe3+-siderophores transport system ATPase subunit